MDSRQDVDDGKKATMTLSKETIEGLTITGKIYLYNSVVTIIFLL